jgi:hypothetical protein
MSRKNVQKHAESRGSGGFKKPITSFRIVDGDSINT